MEIIKKDDQKLVISYDVGEAIVSDKTTGENKTYKLSASNRFSPIIEFPNGDTVILSWEEILNLAIDLYKSYGGTK